MLLVEFYAPNDQVGRQKVAGLLADRAPAVTPQGTPPGDAPVSEPTQAVISAREAHADADRERFWKLRKSGLPILLSRTSTAKHIAFIEDTAVPPESLPGFVSDFQAVLERNDTYASFYAHAGPGCLHVRPLINTTSVDGVERVMRYSYGLCEYLDTKGLLEGLEQNDGGQTVTYHGHCHQKATGKDHHAVAAMRAAGYEVDPVDSTCCGMAGSFGYEAEHYSMSQAIGRILFEQVEQSPGERVVAPGASCRTQLGDRPAARETPPHPAELLAEAIE